MANISALHRALFSPRLLILELQACKFGFQAVTLLLQLCQLLFVFSGQWELVDDQLYHVLLACPAAQLPHRSGR
jgi:hypothetical protein